MAAPVVETDSLGKRYRLSRPHHPRGQLSEALEGALRAQLRRLRGRGREDRDELFWALRDGSLSVAEGEAVGVVGPNGAGKSTLLKLLSRITVPSEGRIRLRGRVATILEVGTGFHPELTGRENIYLNATILGMRRREVDARFDAIVDFSGIERFIDTPVKRYSSGMYVRLAFAVAAHLESEILLIDEVLAVGDAEFQRKCLRKMGDVVSGQGRTIVFVSHNLAAVERLCERAFLIEGGRVALESSAHAVVQEYLRRHEPVPEGGEVVVPDKARRIGGEDGRLVSLALLGADGHATSVLVPGCPFEVRARFQVDKPVEQAVLQLGVSTVEGWRIATALSTDGGGAPVGLEPGMHEFTASLELPLLPQDFTLDVALVRSNGVAVDSVERVLGFAVEGVSTDPLERQLRDHVGGFVRPKAAWRHVALAAEASIPARSVAS